MKEIVFYLIFFNPHAGYGTTPVALGAYVTKQQCEVAKQEVANLGYKGSIDYFKTRMVCLESGTFR